MTRLLLIAGASLLCTGCVTYTQPPEGPGVAYMDYRKGEGSGSIYRQQVLSRSDGPACGRIERIATYQPAQEAIGIGGDKQFRVQAGVRTYFLAESFNAPGGANQYQVCANVSSFVPEAGRHYAISQTFPQGSCSMEIVDAADGSTPASVQRHPVGKDCRYVK